jgi:outer membrane lipoprotein carrier protein
LTIRIIFITGALFAAQVIAADQQVDEGKVLVEAFITDVDTLSGSFEQSLVDAEGQVLEVTSGTLEVQRPGRFRWAYSEPYEQWLIADGVNIWSYDIDLEQVTVKPQAEALANTPALLLGGSDAAMDQFEYQGSVTEAGVIWVKLVPVNTDSGFKRVELAFTDQRLRQMVFFDNLEQTTFVSLDNVLVNEPIDAGRFEFVAPDHVDVVGSPATVDPMVE